MSLTSILLLLTAAVTHAGWNFISKREQPTLAFYLVANTIGVCLVLPFLFIFRDKMTLIPPLIWVFAGMSGFFLASMNYVTNVNYVSAFRQLSIPIGALMGIVLLKEPGYIPKIVGVGAIFVGLVLVGFG